MSAIFINTPFGKHTDSVASIEKKVVSIKNKILNIAERMYCIIINFPVF